MNSSNLVVTGPARIHYKVDQHGLFFGSHIAVGCHVTLSVMEMEFLEPAAATYIFTRFF